MYVNGMIKITSTYFTPVTLFNIVGSGIKKRKEILPKDLLIILRGK